MDKTELKGLLREVNQEVKAEQDAREKAEREQEAIAKALEENKELKAKVEALKNQKKEVELTGSGNKKVKVYRGWDMTSQGLQMKDVIADEDLKDRLAKHVIDVVEKAKSMNGSKTIEGLQEGTASEGGYLVPDEFDNTVLAFARRDSVALDPANGISMYNMKRDTLKIPAELTSVSVAWTAEEADATLTKPSFAEVTLTAYRLDGYVAVTNELLEDSIDDVVSRLMSQFGEAIGTEIDNQVFNGTGSPMAGILPNAGLSYNSTDATTSGIYVNEDDWAKIVYTLPIKVRKGAKWYLPTGSIATMLNTDDSGSNRIFSLERGDVPKILGYPVIEVSNLPAYPQAADTALVFSVI
jgi:HK97 family phage major capsid protein